MDKKQLTSIANQNNTTRALFEHFKSRERNPKEGIMDLTRVKSHLQYSNGDIVPAEFLAGFKALERAGVGKLIIEKGKNVRFKWTVDMKDAMADLLVAEEPTAMPKKTRSHIKSQPAGAESSVVIMLGRGRKATLTVPIDLAPEEVEFIADSLHGYSE